MAISTNQISTQETAQRKHIMLPMTETQPQLGPLPEGVTPVQPANGLVGWYNASSDMVELYMVNSWGDRYIRVTSLPN